jgi:hypothetical protein
VGALNANKGKVSINARAKIEYLAQHQVCYLLHVCFNTSLLVSLDFSQRLAASSVGTVRSRRYADDHHAREIPW